MISQPVVETRPIRQRLVVKAPNSEGLFQDMICFQAQFEDAARQAVELRLSGDLAATIRTWSLRGTLQVALEDDTRKLVLMTRDRNMSEALRVLANHGLTESEAWDVAAIVCSVLEGAGEVPRDALHDPITSVVGKGKSDVALSSWGGVLKLVATQYVLDVRNVEGKGVTLRLGDRFEGIGVREAVSSYIGPLWERFLLGYGPATLKDFRTWLGVSASTVSGQGIVAPEDAAQNGKEVNSHILVLPAFDPYIISTASRDLLYVSDRVRDGVIRRGGWLASCVVSGHSIVGYRIPGNKGRYAIDERHVNRVKHELPDLPVTTLN